MKCSAFKRTLGLLILGLVVTSWSGIVPGAPRSTPAYAAEGEGSGSELPAWRKNEEAWICHCRRPIRDADGNVKKSRGRIHIEQFRRRLCVTKKEATDLCRNKYSYGEGDERVDCMVYRSKHCSPEESCRKENRGCAGDWCNCGARIEVVRREGRKSVDPGQDVAVGDELDVYVHRPTDQGTTFADADRSWLWKGVGEASPESAAEAESGCVYLDWDADRTPPVNENEASTCVTGVDPETQTKFVLRGAYASAGKKTIYANLDNWFAGPEDCKYRCQAEATFELNVTE